ncbi:MULTISPECIES: hypothetical protein [Streptomycetaceae]|uniref:Uncharacterized protein n=1 Tax=Streptantibioticus cattleyicolor (strain ATCC 35852 / DSM 46488 / JCM 4925 / NBRC 14057 / NRRL 8057) TaxID=1003195 RepID=F8JRD0_STREN|nr:MULTISPECIES: hypothetical protein [Streptomycetaceae]AEW96631.1 hypothetical protein SCATT_42600 [Streptantibioticus cattleyicolor NRRL 8057 = DSM 46488]MYS61123.1 hypothetical protein [Streptomyces sp. SID5468]CCB76968.1 conserved protein of unknown function [Streptantibioticus cattleyicolor NRRL 8057 = DSM 46488]
MPALRAARAVVSPPPRPYDEDPARLAYYRDLVEPFGTEVDEALLRSAPHVGHTDLVDLLTADDTLRRCAPDLVVVAQALPDITPFTAIGPYLDRRLGGGSTNFGIHQQGLSAPFTALRAIAAFQRAGRSRTAVLAVLEQTTLPSRFPLVHDGDLVDSAVALVLDDGDGPRVDEVVTVPAGEPAAPRAAELAAKDPEGTLLVTGSRFDDAGLTGDVHRYRVEPGTYCTGVWLALAREWRDWQRRYAVVVLCDTDPRSGTSHLAVLRSPAAGEGAGDGLG